MTTAPKPKLSPAQASQPLRVGDLGAVARGFAPGIKELIVAHTRPLEQRIEELETVVRAMVEARVRDG